MELDATVSVAALAAASAEQQLESKLKLFPSVHVAAIDGMGRGIVAARDISEGEVLIEEASFAWENETSGSAPDLCLGSDCHDDSGVLDALLLQMCPFELPAGHGAAGTAASRGFTPLSRREAVSKAMCANAFGVRDLSAAAGEDASDPAAALDSSSASYAGRALFSVICLANHSCSPAARVYQKPGSGMSRDNPPVYCLETRRPVAAGEQVTVAYVPRAWRQAQRRSAIASTWGFTCTCPRCASPYDDSVVLRCLAPASECEGGRLFLGQPECQDCGAAYTGPRSPPLSLSAYTGPRSQAAGSAAAVPAAEAEDSAGASAPAVGGAGAAAPRPASTAPADAASVDVTDDDAVTAQLLAPVTAGDIEAAVELALRHPLLAHEDVRVWGALNRLLQLLPALCEQLEAAGAVDEAFRFEGWQGEVMEAVAAASLRTAFANPHDLGIAVEVQYE